jgi:DNA-binding Xre family transcriptional regulator
MVYDFDTIDYNRLCDLVKAKGFTDRRFSKLLWGDKTHLNLKYFIKKSDVRISMLFKLARILDCEIEDFFHKSDNSSDNPPIIGSHNIVNSSLVNTDITNLKAENRALKMVIEEKKARIEDLKKTNDELGKRLDLVLQIGHK